MSVCLVECPTGQAFPYFAFVYRMHIQRISPVAADGHAAVRNRLHQFTLAVAEPGPARTVDAR